MIVLAANIVTPAAAIEFSADTIQRQPGQDMRIGKIALDKAGNTRIEFQRFGRPIVHIIRPADAIVRELYPLERSYIEFKVPTEQLANREQLPCMKTPQVSCKKIGEAIIGGFKTERWTSSATRAPHFAVIWWDTTRKLALRREYSDGRTMQAILLGNEKFNDQPVERWELIFMAPNNRYHRVMLLYSRKLRRPLLKLGSDGSLQELRNIEIKSPDKTQFEVPANYRRIETAQPKNTRPADQLAGQTRPDTNLTSQGAANSGTNFVPPALRAPFAYPGRANRSQTQNKGVPQ